MCFREICVSAKYPPMTSTWPTTNIMLLRTSDLFMISEFTKSTRAFSKEMDPSIAYRRRICQHRIRSLGCISPMLFGSISLLEWAIRQRQCTKDHREEWVVTPDLLGLSNEADLELTVSVAV